MALPPLDCVLSPVPAYGLTTPLERIALALGQLGAVPPSHIVVVDGEQHPLGAIALGRLWAASQAALPPGEGIEASPLRLADCQAWLEPVVAVVDREWGDCPTSARLRAMALEPTFALWVCTSADGCYRGVLNPLKLMAWLGAPEPLDTGNIAAPPLELGQQAWVLELSHALKTPMTTLLGLSTLLLDSRVGSLSDRQFRYVSLMRQAIRKLTGLINLLLDWMRLESGQLSLNLERVDLKPMADELLSSFLSVQPEGGAAAWAEEFTVDWAIAEGWVQADPLRLRQSLHYGLGYLLAHGATPGGLAIEPWGPWLSLTLWSSTFIVDPGPPLEPSILGFETQPAPQALEGLGIALARRFSQLQGGEFSGLSVPTWGSRMTLLLPQPSPAHEGETVLVLLASASMAVVDQVYGSLRGSPYRLAVAACGQALAAMQARLAPRCTLIHWEGLADAPVDGAAQMAFVQRLEISKAVVLQSSPGNDAELVEVKPGATPLKTLYLETLTQGLRTTLDQICLAPLLPLPDGLTMLLLRPSAVAEPSTLPPLVHTWLQRYHCRLLQVDDLQQASLLSRVWRPQAVILDGAEAVSIAYLQDVAHQPDLAKLPLITLVPPANEDAAVALGLTLIPCPEVLTQPPALAVVSLMRAIALHLAES
ncbi:HAMP domain-containing sensor histidine kinase [Leptolyngbya sp. CCNP1308]|uniref:sensor histidine kinase n=1 Tax=Leptolyngbya sp. CCNP1308 TaxID=3110255 RepID=UPI002B20CEDD|nr:HAMP domain-containing sensor histidine kinase [Leptolyngbya sp. CCNP1308]MEA5450736.1 HAMP domain-containing sensor histidine kinase [Leptolyngbya sp. CCNP1308]